MGSPSFYQGNPFKKFPSLFILKKSFKFKTEFDFNFFTEIPLKISHLQFYKKIPFKIILTHIQFYKRNPYKFLRKEMNPEIWLQKYNLGPTSWRPFLKKVIVVF